MQKVTALIINEGSLPLIISSDNAVFNNITYNTSFDKNVTINYINNSIKSQKLYLDFFLPKLQKHFAEFLQHSYSKRLSILY